MFSVHFWLSSVRFDRRKKMIIFEWVDVATAIIVVATAIIQFFVKHIGWSRNGTSYAHTHALTYKHCQPEMYSIFKLVTHEK